MIIEKSAEVMATKSYYKNQMANISICKKQQSFWYKKFKKLLNYIHSVSEELKMLNMVPDPVTKSVRNVGTYVDIV